MVVVVENDEAVQAAIAPLLLAWGCTRRSPTRRTRRWSGSDALGRTPDLIVADYRLDGGSLGTAVIDALHLRYGAEVPALVISGDRSEALEAEIRALGPGFLSKPVAPAKLRAMLSYLLREARKA